MKYHTMVEMAKIIGIPESTARGYRDRFPSYFSTTGQGRGKRYTEEAMEALRIVAPMSRQGIPIEDIETALEARFGVVVESQDSQSQIVVSQSQIVADENQALVAAFVSELTAMREQVAALQTQLEARDDSRDRQLVAVMREIQEMRQEIRQPWWRKIFQR